MRHCWTTAVVVIGLCALPVRAEEIKGQIKAVDADKGVLTVTVGEKDQEFQIPAEAKIRVTEAVQVRDAKDGLKDPDVKKGFNVKITTEEKDGKIVVKEVLILTGRRVEGVD
jgi:hypothetical protein